MLETLKERLASIVRLGSVALVKSGKTQSLQVEMTTGETADNVKFIEPYGFTAVPHNKSECTILNLNAFGTSPIALVVGGRAFRLQDLKQGEVALYTDEGDRIHFKRGNTVEVKTKHFIVDAAESATINAKKIALNAPDGVAITSALAVSGNITGAAEVSDKIGTMAQMRVTYNTTGHNPTTFTHTLQMGG